MKKNYKLIISIFFMFLVLFLAKPIYAADGYINLDMINTVDVSDDNFSIIVDATDSWDLNIYHPEGALITTESGSGSNTLIFDTNSLSLEPSVHPYLARAQLSTTDDNPSNNIFYKYFTVVESDTKIPVSDVPLFSGFFIALIAGFIISSRTSKSKKSKK